MHNHEDALYESYIESATSVIEGATGRSLIQKTYTEFLDQFEYQIELFRVPHVSISHIRYKDEDDVIQTVDPSNYQVTYDDASTLITPVNEPWPCAKVFEENSVEIEYISGHASTAEQLRAVKPQAFHCVMMLAAHYNMHREPMGMNDKTIPYTIQSLMASLNAGRMEAVEDDWWNPWFNSDSRYPRFWV